MSVAEVEYAFETYSVIDPSAIVLTSILPAIERDFPIMNISIGGFATLAVLSVVALSLQGCVAAQEKKTAQADIFPKAKVEAPERNAEMSLIDDVRVLPLSSESSCGDAKDTPNIRSRWLLSDKAGIAISLDDRIMYQRFPLGMAWKDERAVGTPYTSKYDKESQWDYDRRYADLNGWRMPWTTEVRAMRADCYGIDLKPILGEFPKTIEIDVGGRKSRTEQRRVAFVGKDAGRTDGGIPVVHLVHLGADRGMLENLFHRAFGDMSGRFAGITILVRDLPDSEFEHYEQIYRKSANPGKTSKSFVVKVNDVLIDGNINALLDGEGSIRFPSAKMSSYKNYYEGGLRNGRPHGKGVLVSEFSVFDVIHEDGREISRTQKTCEIKSDALMDVIKTLSPLGTSWNVTNKRYAQLWLGDCPGGVPKGKGRFFVRSTGNNGGKTVTSYATGVIDMVNGVPHGEMTIKGFAQTGTVLHYFESPGIFEYPVAMIKNGVVASNYYLEAKTGAEKAVWKAAAGAVGGMIKDSIEYCQKNNCPTTPATTPVPEAKKKETAAPAQKAAPARMNIAQDDGKASNGLPQYKITCANGSVRRVYRSSDNTEWRDVGYGGMGLGGLSPQDLADKICR